MIANPEQHTCYQDTEIKQLLDLTTVYVGGHWCVPVPSAARHSAGGAEERDAPQPEGIDGPRRARRHLKLKPIISTIALMKAIIKR